MNFFGIILFIIYIGAISILFIIVIMTINLQITDKNVKNNFYKVLFSLNIFIIFIDKFLFINKNFLILIINSFFELNMNKSLVENIGNTIFIKYFLVIIIMALILFISLIGTLNLLAEKELKKKNTFENIQYSLITKKIVFLYK